MNDLFFGTDAQQSMLRRSRALFDLLSADNRLTYYGRGVGIMDPRCDGALDLSERLVAIQGASNFGHVATADEPALAKSLEARGYALTRYAKWEGGQSALDAAHSILNTFKMPADLTVHVLDEHSPDDHLAKLAQVSLACGVLPIAGSVLRGASKPGLGVVAVDATGAPVSCAAAASYTHPGSYLLPDQCWWGMLGTAPSHRGQKLALILGAIAIREGHRRFGFSNFMTGVVPGNSASEAVCTKTGLSVGSHGIITIVDAKTMGGGKLTS